MLATIRLRALSTLAYFACLLVDPSRGFATALLARAPHASPATTGSTFSSYNSYSFNARISPSAATQGEPSARLVSTVARLRGGSPTSPSGNGNVSGNFVAMVAGGEVAAAALDALHSATAHVPLGGPALFAQGVAVSLLLSADGFRVREHFVSYGYGFSVAFQAAAASWLFRDGLHTLSALHAAGLVAYGLRLVLFCRWRDTLPSFQDLRKQLSKPKSGRPPFSFWGVVSVLYAFLALPSVYVLRRLPAAEGRYLGVSQAGLAVMAIGLLVEGVADWQKSSFKKKQPGRFCDTGLYRFCRHPNYFGETVFWTGVWVAAIPSFSLWYHWLLAAIGPSQMVSIITRATKGLEKRQGEKYDSNKEYQAYKRSTPVLVPGSWHYDVVGKEEQGKKK